MTIENGHRQLPRAPGDLVQVRIRRVDAPSAPPVWTASARCSDQHASGAQRQLARALAEPGSISSCSYCEPTTGSPSKRSTASRLSRPRRTCSASASSASASHVALERIAQRQQPLAAPLHVEHRLGVQRHHVGAAARGWGAPARLGVLALGPRQRGAVRVGGVGGGQHQRRPRARPSAARAGARSPRAARTARRPGPRRSSRGGRCPASRGWPARRRARRSRPGCPRPARSRA